MTNAVPHVHLQSGVDGPMEQLVGSLIQSDTASAFNISLQDVTVETSRRVPACLHGSG